MLVNNTPPPTTTHTQTHTRTHYSTWHLRAVHRACAHCISFYLFSFFIVIIPLKVSFWSSLASYGIFLFFVWLG